MYDNDVINYHGSWNGNITIIFFFLVAENGTNDRGFWNRAWAYTVTKIITNVNVN